MADTKFHFQPVIVIGAARSGTNMLRDILSQATGVGTWPCDEINYLWRYRNAHFPTDELQPEHATPRIRSYIRRQFAEQATRTQSRWLVEKTCANSLRIGYVDQIVPEAKYIFLVRDGLDVLASAQKRWHAPLEISYLAKKAMYIPWGDIPYYAGRYLSHRVKRWLNADRRLPTWGPRFKGMDEAMKSRSSLEVCALQWRRSLELAAESLWHMPAHKFCIVSYESFVKDPTMGLKELFEFLNIPCSAEQCSNLVQNVSSKSVGKGIAAISSTDLSKVQPHVTETLKKLRSLWPMPDVMFTQSSAA